MIEYLKPFVKSFIIFFLATLPLSLLLSCFVLMMWTVFDLSTSGPTASTSWLLEFFSHGGGFILCLVSPSLILALAISLGLVSGQIIAVKRVHSQGTKKSLDNHQTRKVEVNYPYRKTFQLCLEAIKELGNCKIRKTDSSRGIIEARTGISLRTYGDNISFEIQQLDNERTQVEISSRPMWWPTIVDYGRNLENVEKIKSFLQEQNVSHSQTAS